MYIPTNSASPTTSMRRFRRFFYTPPSRGHQASGSGAEEANPPPPSYDTFLPYPLPSVYRLLEVSEETYKMPPDSCKANNEASVAAADFERVGLEVFGYISNAEHDTHCFVLKDDRRAVRSYVLHAVLNFRLEPVFVSCGL